jgi:hypothetical protein
MAWRSHYFGSVLVAVSSQLFKGARKKVENLAISAVNAEIGG